MQPYINRQNKIHAALDTLKNYLINSKPPSVNSVANNFRLRSYTLMSCKNNATGSYISPLIIYKGVCTIPNLLEGASSGTVMGFTNTG
ncbi:7795_t:CDS:2, partial [Funneliformis geosporum]